MTRLERELRQISTRFRARQTIQNTKDGFRKIAFFNPTVLKECTFNYHVRFPFWISRLQIHLISIFQMRRRSTMTFFALQNSEVGTCLLSQAVWPVEYCSKALPP